jgi:peptidoglycan/xylan/chitin deacetylase (PgdA/CDA1 family)
MYNGETEVGITIHQVAEAVDAGDVYLQRTFPLDPAAPQEPMDYIANYRAEILRPNGVAMLREVVASIASGTAKPVPQEKGAGTTYRSPNYANIRELRRRVRVRRNEPTRWKRHVKALIGRVIYGLRLHRALLGNKGLVVLFHRIDDRLQGNPISATSQEFAEFCAFFAKYFRVVSMEEMLRLIDAGASLRGVCCITFDDGYLDNLTIAARTLKHHSLPACFFISSGMIGSQVRPWWDATIPIRTIWMQPDDLRTLARDFEIGAHTIHHVDLGQVTGAEAHAEIAQSKSQLEALIGREVPYFTYPYGGKQHITEPNLDLIRSAGYRCCMSAFGGAVEPKTDLFRIKRAPISPWFLSPYQFGFEAIFFET